jgi:hypothetical protein
VRIQTFNNPRRNKPTREYVAEAIGCVCRQTYPNWKIFLTGDCYRPRSEFRKLARLAPPGKIVAINMPRAPEREIHTGYNLWCCGGVTSFNFTLDLMNELGISHVANYDDDDIWLRRHLEFHAESYNSDPNIAMVLTHGHFKLPNNILPKHRDAPRSLFYPSKVWPEKLTSIAGNSCNCATSWDMQRMPLRARNPVQESPWIKHSWDYVFWKEFEEKSAAKGYKMVLRPEITVYQRHSHIPNDSEPVMIDTSEG